jgi:hypothetical protein
MLSAKSIYQRDSVAVESLRGIITQPWFEKALLAARSEVVTSAKSLDEIKGADRLAEYLLDIASDPEPEVEPMSSGIQHDTDYARGTPNRTALDKKRRQPENTGPVTGKAGLVAAAARSPQS